MEHFKLSDLKYILNLHKGFRTTPLWLHKQAPVDFSPKLKSSLIMLAHIYASKYFQDRPTTVIGSEIPYFLPIEEAQMAEIQIAMKYGPLRTDAFIDEIILSFIYPTSTTQLCQLLGRALEWMDMEFYLEKIAEAPETFYKHVIFSHAFLEEKIHMVEYYGQDVLTPIFHGCAANGNLEQVQELWPRIKAHLESQINASLPIAEEEKKRVYHLPAFVEARRFSPLTTCLAGTANFAVFSFLIEEGYPFLLAEDEDLMKALVESGQTKHLKAIFAKDPVEPYSLPFSPFEIPVVKADHAMIQCLCDLGFRLNRQNDASTPLFISISRRLYQTTDLLLKNGASLSFAFKQGFGGGVMTPEFLAFTEKPDLILFSQFLDEVSEHILLGKGDLLEHYLEDRLLFTQSLQDLLEKFTSLAHGEVECILWVLATMDNLSLSHPEIKISRIQPGNPKPLEAFLVDLNHFMLLLFQQTENRENLKTILFELGKRQDYCFLPWQKILPRLLGFDSKSFDYILHSTDFFYRFRDANLPPDYLWQAQAEHQQGKTQSEENEDAAEKNWQRQRFKLFAGFQQQSPALYLAHHRKYSLLGQLLKRQQDLPFWQSQYGDSLLSLAMMQGEEKLLLTLSHHGASLGLSLQIAIQEGNLYLCEYILFWILRNMRFNHATFYQALILQGLDIHSLILAAKSQGKKEIYRLLFDWLKLFPAHLQIFKNQAELLPSKELKPTDLGLRPTQLSKEIAGELLNPNHRLNEEDPLEESDYLLPEFRFSLLLKNHEITTANLFTELHPSQGTLEVESHNQDDESFIKELAKLYAQEKSQPVIPDQYLPVLCQSTPEALRVVALYHNPSTGDSQLFLHDLHTEKAQHFEDPKSKILATMEPDLIQFFFLSKNEFLLLDLTGNLEIWSLKSLQKISSQSFCTTTNSIEIYSRAFLSKDQNKLFLQGENSSLLWDLAQGREINHLQETKFLHYPLHFEEKLIGMDQGTWMNSAPETFHHLYQWEFNAPAPKTENPCPLMKVVQPVQFGKPICFSGENELMRPCFQFFHAKSHESITFHFDSQPVELLSQSRDGSYALVLEDHHAKLLDLEAQATTIINLDFSWIESATFGGYNQFLTLFFREDIFRNKPPKFEIFDIEAHKIIFSHTLEKNCLPFDLQNEELVGFIDHNNKIQIFDLIHFHFLTAIQHLLNKNAEI